MKTERRRFLKLAGTTAAGALALAHPLVVQAASTLPDQPIAYAGTNLEGWSVCVGDGVFAAPGEAGVSDADITTVHNPEYTELRANVNMRRVEAHNITHQSVRDANVLAYAHLLEYEFRLPYMPSREYPDGCNAQTLEGGLGFWDGATTRTKYGVGFQWGLNPWDRFGELRVWTGINNQGWLTVGTLTPDTEWHRLRILCDIANDTASLSIDGVAYPAMIGKDPAPAGWGNEVCAGPSAEIISIYPGDSGRGGLHYAHFRNWVWYWQPVAQNHIFLPNVQR